MEKAEAYLNEKHLQFTSWINQDYAHKEWEIRKIA